MTNLDRAITRRSDMIRAVLYCRVSTKEQTLNLSLPTQREACREYCTREGFEVAAEFIEEGESAKTTARPQLQRLLAYCRQHRGQVQFLIVYNLSRFARERHDHVVLRVLLQQLAGAPAIIDSSSPALVHVLNFLMALILVPSKLCIQ